MSLMSGWGKNMLSADCYPQGLGEEGFYWLKLIGRISRLKADQIPLQMQSGTGSMNSATNGLPCQCFPTPGLGTKSIPAVALRGLAFPGSRSRSCPTARALTQKLRGEDPCMCQGALEGREGGGSVVVPVPVPHRPCSALPRALHFGRESSKLQDRTEEQLNHVFTYP